MMFYSTLAAVTLVVHVAYVAFVVLGLLLIWAGIACHWKWVHNSWFRTIHLVMIAMVVLEAWAGIVCPLTTLENWFRKKSGQHLYDGDFISIWLHDLLFIELPPWAFTSAYTLFGLAVLGTLWLAPPRLRQVSQPSGS